MPLSGQYLLNNIIIIKNIYIIDWVEQVSYLHD